MRSTIKPVSESELRACSIDDPSTVPDTVSPARLRAWYSNVGMRVSTICERARLLEFLTTLNRSRCVVPRISQCANVSCLIQVSRKKRGGRNNGPYQCG